ncbi:MAG: outer membrane protein assembly factor BamD [Verrucomicrobia subdivision 3 bacterium]|nr:outer membrane protein assembly factor BamD [Limisphaerales bacterium]
MGFCTANAQTPESRVYDAALHAYEDGIFDLAEREFAAFVQTYPNSPRVPEAILYRARAALRQQHAKVALDILSTNAHRAGDFADQYRYWIGEAHRQDTNYQAAAETFARLIQDFPASPRLLDASYGEALARFKLGQWERVIDLLRNTNSTFQKQAVARQNDELVIRGELLLAEALLENGMASQAEAVLRLLARRDLLPEFAWRAQYTLCRVQLADQRPAEALAGTTNLIAAATASGRRQFQAESHALQATILEQLGREGAAALAHERNLSENAPAEFRRQALLRIIELLLRQDNIAGASQKLESFLAQYPREIDSEVALLTLGELHLRRHLALVAAGITNLPAAQTNLQTALAHFDRLITNAPFGDWVGKAHLNRGWCLWFDGKIPECQEAFKAAIDTLPPSPDEAVARFKLADVQFQMREYTNAIANYRAVVTAYDTFPDVQRELAPQALYQIVRANIELNDLPGASAAMQQIVRSYGESPYADRGLLLLGQRFTQVNRAADGRALFSLFISRYPDSQLLPEVELAIARSYVEERDWNAALREYESWLQRFGTNNLRPRAEINYAFANYHAGRLTNALTLFTNFLASFPTHPLAPRAKYWVGSFYYDQQKFADAELHFVELFKSTNWPAGELKYQAQMMAGHSAFARQDYKAAKDDYYLPLLNDNTFVRDYNELAAEVFFAVGDTLTLQEADSARPTQRFEEAIVAFEKIPRLFPNSYRVPLAWGRIGDCYRQLASYDPKFFENATNAYNQVLAPTSTADISARSQAEVGLGQVTEQLARTLDPDLWKLAFQHYYNVVSGRSVERIDPHWFREAGNAAARLAEEHQQWDVAIRIYARMIEVLPPLRPMVERKMERAREQLRTETR